MFMRVKTHKYDSIHIRIMCNMHTYFISASHYFTLWVLHFSFRFCFFQSLCHFHVRVDFHQYGQTEMKASKETDSSIKHLNKHNSRWKRSHFAAWITQTNGQIREDKEIKCKKWVIKITWTNDLFRWIFILFIHQFTNK